MRTREECIKYCEMFLNTLAKIKSEDVDYLNSMIVYLKLPEDQPFDFENYDPSRDADEEKGHLCNCLNTIEGWLRYDAEENKLNARVLPVGRAELIANYLFRAQKVVWYLRDKKFEDLRMTADYSYWFATCRCSNCGEHILTSHHNYCPNCGARVILMNRIKCYEEK